MFYQLAGLGRKHRKNEYVSNLSVIASTYGPEYHRSKENVYPYIPFY